MPLTRRYEPPHRTGPRAYGMDYSSVIPWGMTITSAALTIWSNTQPPLDASADFSTPTIYTRGRQAFAIINGGVVGKDYLLQWSVNDNRGGVWDRAATLLCSYTS